MKMKEVKIKGPITTTGFYVTHENSNINKDTDLGIFLNWLLKHYNTATDDVSKSFYYTNSQNQEVTIAEIIEHFNRDNMLDFLTEQSQELNLGYNNTEER
jgi:hypothetical protein